MMKKVFIIRWLLTATICILFVSCQKFPEDNDSLSESETPVIIKTRSVGSTSINYPLYLYAFNDTGKCAASQTIESADEPMELSLANGSYRIVAVSGTSESYDIPENPTTDDVITLNGSSETPLMIGKADITIENTEEATLNITLAYAVAAVNVSLENLPSNVSAVRFSLSPLYSTLSLGGEYGGTSIKMETDCKLDTSNVWSSKTAYIFPGKDKETVFSIVLIKKDGSSNTYGYTYAGTPEIGRPFNITGNYSGGITISGNVIGSDWGAPIEVNFDFGATSQTEKEENEETSTELSELPEVGSIWNGSIVAAINKSDEKEAELFLLSLEEWDVKTSQIKEVTDSYEVNGMSNWRLPTYEEALVLRNNYSGDGRITLNDRIKEYDNSLYGLDGEERYLCNKDGTYYSFIFSGETTISPAGTQRSYYVRLVRTYPVTLP